MPPYFEYFFMSTAYLSFGFFVSRLLKDVQVRHPGPEAAYLPVFNGVFTSLEEKVLEFSAG